jgi:hypothetical protein
MIILYFLHFGEWKELKMLFWYFQSIADAQPIFSHINAYRMVIQLYDELLNWTNVRVGPLTMQIQSDTWADILDCTPCRHGTWPSSCSCPGLISHPSRSNPHLVNQVRESTAITSACSAVKLSVAHQLHREEPNGKRKHGRTMWMGRGGRGRGEEDEGGDELIRAAGKGWGRHARHSSREKKTCSLTTKQYAGVSELAPSESHQAERTHAGGGLGMALSFQASVPRPTQTSKLGIANSNSDSKPQFCATKHSVRVMFVVLDSSNVMVPLSDENTHEGFFLWKFVLATTLIFSQHV